MLPTAEIGGSCEERFSGVRDVLAANLDSGLDVGASVAVVLEDEPVGARHHYQRLVNDQDDDGAVRAHAVGSKGGRSAFAGRPLLARVRRLGQRGRRSAPPAESYIGALGLG